MPVHDEMRLELQPYGGAQELAEDGGLRCAFLCRLACGVILFGLRGIMLPGSVCYARR